jgi:hypothetical protein
LVSPILVRPVREQLEHDRIIRLLQSKFRRKYEAGMNPGAEQNAPVGAVGSSMYPDLVLASTERGKRLMAVVEVETGESVNHLEALAQWAHFGRLRAAFHLYVPANMVDVARRLCDDNQIHVTEVWSYHMFGDEIRFTLVHKSRESESAGRVRPTAVRPNTAARPNGAAARTAAAPPRRKAAAPAAKRTARPSKPAVRGKTVKKAGRTQKRK